MKSALIISALVLCLCATVGGSQQIQRSSQHDACVSAVDDPDPSECPFCGGNPAVHVQKMFQLERVSMGLFTTLLR